MRVLALIALLFLASCAGKDKPIETTVTVNDLGETVIIIPVRPESVNTLPVEWKVLTNTILLDLVNSPSFTQDGIVFYALTVQDYENLSLTIAELLRYIEQQNEIIVYYETVVNN